MPQLMFNALFYNQWVGLGFLTGTLLSVQSNNNNPVQEFKHICAVMSDNTLLNLIMHDGDLC